MSGLMNKYPSQIKNPGKDYLATQTNLVSKERERPRIAIRNAHLCAARIKQPRFDLALHA